MLPTLGYGSPIEPTHYSSRSRLSVVAAGFCLLAVSAFVVVAGQPAANFLAVVEQEVSANESPAGNQFGYSVALSGNTALIGAWSEDDAKGAAYFYTKSGQTWVESQRIQLSHPSLFDDFGANVALEGDTAVVSAAGSSIYHHNNAGAVYVYNLARESWVQRQVLTAPGAPRFGYFGLSLALKGDYLAVGDPSATVDGKFFQGAVFVFVRSDGVWTFRQEITAADGVAYDRFGGTVAVSADGTIFADSEAPVNGVSGAGTVYVFTLEGDTWTETQKLTASDPEDNAYFGSAIACGDSAIFVGAFGATVNGYEGAGKVYVFTNNGGSFTEIQQVMAPEPKAFSSFGGSIAISGSTLAISAPAMELEGQAGRGATYIFRGAPGSYSFRQQLTASNGLPNSFFGHSVALSEGTVLVGAPDQPVRTEFPDGAAYFYSQQAR